MKKRSYINFKAIGLSLVFLLNPNIGVIDFLPDFIGYIILCSLLVKLGDVNDTVAEALNSFKKMIFIDAAKIIAIVWVFGFADGSERTSSILLWTFAFGALEIIFLVPAFIKLFKGITELGYFNENTSILGSKRKNSKNYTDKIRSLTVFFVCFKAVLSFLPEFSDLSSADSLSQGMYRYIGLLRGMAFIPVLIVGIAWFIRFVSYFSRISKDTIFIDSLKSIYEERVLPKKGLFAKRRFAVANVLLTVAAVFSFDFRVQEVVAFGVERESMNLLPDFISAIFLLLFFVMISKCAKISKGLSIALCGVYLAASVLAYVVEWKFFEEYTYSAIYRSVEAMQAYTLVAVCSIASTVLFAIICFMALKALKAVIAEHTGVLSAEEAVNTAALNKMADATRAELEKYLKYCMVAIGIYTVTDICYVVLSADFGFTLLVSMIGFALFIASFIKAYFEIAEAMHSRYLIE